MAHQYCQSCSLPLELHPHLHGTHADGSKSEEYCQYCYENGKFLIDCTMEEMVEICLPGMPKTLSKEEARKLLTQTLPTLKRWKK